MGALKKRAQPKTSARPARRSAPALPPSSGQPTELYRDACEDGEGRPYTVIVWRKYPGLSITTCTLDDGAPVAYCDECTFEIVASRKLISRCL
jgi:hypothetical protein